MNVSHSARHGGFPGGARAFLSAATLATTATDDDSSAFMPFHTAADKNGDKNVRAPEQLKTASQSAGTSSSGGSKVGPAGRLPCFGCGLIVLFAIVVDIDAAQPASPLTPAQELTTFHFADEQLIVELVAAEPEVTSPVAIAWDTAGRMFVAEMNDYPKGPGTGRIKLLEDRDGDGRHERVTIFADNLPFPNGVLPWRGGVLVTAAPNIWFFKDTDGDGVADERRVLLTGFGEGNQQLRVNGLTWGLDNWIYGANGRSEGEVRWADGAGVNGASGKAISIRGRDFRFRPDTGQLEAIAGRSQFGLARDDLGNRFLSWNTIPIRHEVLPERYLSRNSFLAATESLQNLLPPDDTGRVFPLTPPPLTFNNESVQNFNALAGLAIYRGHALGEKYRGNAFAGESLLNLVHRRVLRPSGVSFVADRAPAERDREFLASTDPWFHPVFLTTGPDGCLYVVDFYRRFVEHPDFVHPESVSAKVPWRTDIDHGRIWRIRARNFHPETSIAKLAKANALELIQGLLSQNAWRRDTAQRLLIERRSLEWLSALESVIRNPRTSDPLARLHAISALDGLGALSADTLTLALRDSQPAVREHALRLSEPFLSGRARVTPRPEEKPLLSSKSANDSTAEMKSLREAVLRLVEDPEPRVRFQLALTLGEIEGKEKLAALLRLAQNGVADRWQSLAILSSLGRDSWPFLKTLSQEFPQWLKEPTADQSKFLEQIAALVGAAHREAELAECVEWLSKPSQGHGHLAVLAGLADGLKRASRSVKQWTAQPPVSPGKSAPSLSPLMDVAVKTAASDHESWRDRLVAIRVLAHTTPERGGRLLLDLLQPQHPAEVHSTAARALAELADPALTTAMFAGWNKYSMATKRDVLAAAVLSPTATLALLDALEHGVILPIEIDPASSRALRKSDNAAIRQRAEKLFQAVTSPDREAVMRRFQPALTMTGDRVRGAAVFNKICFNCHSVQGKGNHVGPDLSGIASRPKETLLADLLDPSRQVSSDFLNYTLVTVGGDTLNGLIASETATSVTLRRQAQPDETVLRGQIKELRAEGKSLMPDGLEQGLTPQDFADLLEFLVHPDIRLLPEVKAANPR
ncbi:MAG TPA: PVC-type heme-binding CxxCH protein [Candidatus Eisenbacteria bacterium]|nr:PVC-type heme-binding CxxCH protein [Candidatus Eisenbacteria bacterium]